MHDEVTTSEYGEDNENNQEHDNGYRNDETIIGEDGMQKDNDEDINSENEAD